jgi:hypothetical protein
VVVTRRKDTRGAEGSLSPFRSSGVGESGMVHTSKSRGRETRRALVAPFGVSAWSRRWSHGVGEKKGEPKSSLTPFQVSSFQRTGSQGELAQRNPETRQPEASFGKAYGHNQ